MITGYDLERLSQAAERVHARMLATPLFRDVRSTVEAGNPEIQIVFDQERATQLGLAVRDIADRVVQSVRGEVATRYRLNDKKSTCSCAASTRARRHRRDPPPDRESG